jgi:hypothetical protein
MRKIFDYPTLKAFMAAEPTEAQFSEFFMSTLEPTEDRFVRMDQWQNRKAILRHPKCPNKILEYAATSSVWYERFVAYLTKQSKASGFWRKALKDPDQRVRDAAMNYSEYLRNPLGHGRID